MTPNPNKLNFMKETGKDNITFSQFNLFTNNHCIILSNHIIQAVLFYTHIHSDNGG